MKKLTLAVVLMGASACAMAEAPGGPNCGWGNLLFKGQSGFGPHFVASTTNGTSGNATFGMTSGTNGCSVNGKLTYGGKSLLAANMDEFGEDVARGDGEALTAVAVSLGIAEQDRQLFKDVLHQNFAVLFPSAQVTAADVTASMLTVMRNNERLAKYAS